MNATEHSTLSGYCREVKLRYKKSRTKIFKVGTPGAAADFIRRIAPDNIKEHFIALYLDGSHTVCHYAVITTGLADRTQVHPREVFQPAIACGAIAVVVAHNHPSGELKQSQEDIAVTKRLMEASKIIGIQLLDHIIFTDHGFLSFADEGLLQVSGNGWDSIESHHCWGHGVCTANQGETMAEKTIIYSYPTSPNAKRFGFYNEGCWTVYWGAVGVKHFPSKEKDNAFAFAAQCVGEYTRNSFTPDNYPVR